MPEDTLKRLSDVTSTQEDNPLPTVMRLSQVQNPTNTDFAILRNRDSVQAQKNRGIWDQTKFFLGESIMKPAVRGVQRLPAGLESVWQVGVDTLRNEAFKKLRERGAVFGISEEEFQRRTPEQQKEIDELNKAVEMFNRAEDVSVRLQENWEEIAETGFTERDPDVWRGQFMENPSWTRAVAMGMESAPLLGLAAAVSFATKSPIAGASVVGVIEAAGERQIAKEAGLSVEQANTVFAINTVMLSALETIPLTGFMKGGALPIRAFRGAVQEGTEEVLQELWMNVVARIGYDDTRELTEGLIEGFIAGGISGGVIGGFSPGRATQINSKIEQAIAAGVDIDPMIEAVGDMVVRSADSITENFFDKMSSERGEVVNPFQEGKVPEQASVEGEQARIEAQRQQDIVAEKDVEKTLSKKVSPSKVKAIVREVTGQHLTEPPTIKETAALKRSLKRQEQVSKVAARKMKQETTDILKLRRELRKQPIESITFEERREINTLRSQVKKKMSLEELNNIYEQIQVVKKRGKEKYITTKAIKDAEIAATIDVLVATQNTPTKDAPPPITSVTSRESSGAFPRRVARGSVALTQRPFRLFDMLDNGQNFEGPHNKALYNKVNEAVEVETKLTDSRKKPIFSFMRKNRLTVDQLYQVRNIEGIRLTVSEMLGIYAAWQHQDNTLAVVYGNNIPVETMQKIVREVENDQRLKSFSDEIIKDFNNPENFDRLNRAFIEYTDGKHEITEVKGTYVPIRRVLLGSDPAHKEVANEILERSGLRKAYASRGATYARKNIPAEFQHEVKLDLFSLWNEHIDKTSHFITHGNLIRDLQKVVNDRRFRDSVVNNKKFGKEFHDVITRWVNRQANPSIYKTHHQADKVARALRQNAAIAYLSYNLITMGKQFPSIALLSAEVRPGYLTAGLFDMTVHYSDTVSFIHERSGQMRNRAIERELEEFKRAHYSKYKRMVRKIGESGMKGIYLIDQMVTHSGWIAAYRQGIDNGMSEFEASRNADKVIMRTQPAAHPKDIADIYDWNETANWFLQFSNQLNNIYGMVTWDIPQRFKRGEWDDALRGTVGVAFSAFMIWVMSNGRLPDKEELVEAFSDQFISMMPFVGPMISSYRKGFRDSSVPSLSGISKATQGIGDVISGKPEKAIPKFFEAAMVAGGIPYSQPRRTLRGALDLISGRTYDLRRLIWSEWNLREKNKKRGGRVTIRRGLY